MASTFTIQLPKAELHAHLNGSIRRSTLLELIRARRAAGASTAASVVALEDDVLKHAADATALLKSRSLQESFAMFALIHASVTELTTLARITREMVQDVAADGVLYLEIRTTPRALAGASMADYIATVVHAIRDSVRDLSSAAPVVRLLISFNRAHPLSAAEAIFDAALHARDSEGFIEIVGIELSGDPTRGDATTFFPLLGRARSAGFKLSVHCAEVMNVRETMEIMAFAPDRLGHMCVLTPRLTQQLLDAHRRSGAGGRVMPIEICPTSNLLTLHLPALEHHPTLSPWLEAGYPISICTDDSGVFDVTLSSEYADVMDACGLSRAQTCALALRAFDDAFCSPQERVELRARASTIIESLLSAELPR